MDEFIKRINEENSDGRVGIYTQVEKHLKEKSNTYSLEKLKKYLDFFIEEKGKISGMISGMIDYTIGYVDLGNVHLESGVKTIVRIIALLKEMIAKIDFKNYIQKKMKDPEMATVIKDICASAPSNYNEIKF